MNDVERLKLSVILSIRGVLSLQLVASSLLLQGPLILLSLGTGSSVEIQQYTAADKHPSNNRMMPRVTLDQFVNKPKPMVTKVMRLPKNMADLKAPQCRVLFFTIVASVDWSVRNFSEATRSKAHPKPLTILAIIMTYTLG